MRRKKGRPNDDTIGKQHPALLAYIMTDGEVQMMVKFKVPLGMIEVSREKTVIKSQSKANGGVREILTAEAKKSLTKLVSSSSSGLTFYEYPEDNLSDQIMIEMIKLGMSAEEVMVVLSMQADHFLKKTMHEDTSRDFEELIKHMKSCTRSNLNFRATSIYNQLDAEIQTSPEDKGLALSALLLMQRMGIQLKKLSKGSSNATEETKWKWSLNAGLRLGMVKEARKYSNYKILNRRIHIYPNNPASKNVCEKLENEINKMSSAEAKVMWTVCEIGDWDAGYKNFASRVEKNGQNGQKGLKGLRSSSAIKSERESTKIPKQEETS